MGPSLYLLGILVTLSLSVPLSSPARAELYRWTDARGVVHFADEKPRGTSSQGVTITRELPQVPVIQTRSSGTFRFEGGAGSAATVVRRGPEHRGKGVIDPRACAEVKARLKKIQAQLRGGYREPQGNRLREQRRGLRTRYAHECR